MSYEDGCKVYFDGAWVIIRFSGTEPRVRIFAEDGTVEGAEALLGLDDYCMEYISAYREGLFGPKKD